MSILANLLSVYGKRPIWLAEMTRGATVYRFRLGKPAIVYDGESFAASPLSFDELNYAADIRKDDFTLDGFALSNATTQALIAAGRTPLELRMIRGFEGSTEFVVSYIGRLSNLRFHMEDDRRDVSLVFSSWGDDLSVGSPGPVAGRQCPWRLYSADCAVVEASFTDAATASAYASGVVTVAAAAGEASGYYTGGILTYAGESRTIEKHAGSALTLSSGFTALAAQIAGSGSAAVSIAAGCDKSLTTCRDRFSNIANNGSLPAMTDDPFIKSVF